MNSIIKWGLILGIILAGCSHEKQYIPKPRGYFRIELPEKKYKRYSGDCPYSFEYPVYATISNYSGKNAEPCWMNINFPQFQSIIHITYKKLKGDLFQHIEDIRTFAYKHSVKADDIIENQINMDEKNIYGLTYLIKGNTASSFNFYITDSILNFLSGALYFNVPPNKDSIAPVNNFIIKDIEHLIETFEWK